MNRLPFSGRVVLLLLPLLAILAASFPTAAAHEAEGTSDIGQPGFRIEGFQLRDTQGKNWSLNEEKQVKATVVLFLGTSCPINNALVPRLNELNKKYGQKGVRFVGINSNSQESADEVAEHVREYGVTFPVLKDVGNEIADRFGAERNPEVFVLDSQRVIRYRGRVDDQFGIGFKRPKATRDDLAVALDELLAGKSITQPVTPVAGCLIGRVVRPKTDAQIVYTRHIAPILQKHCQECHRPGQIGPMSLLTYKDAAGWAAMIREVVEDKRMPPWHADPAHGKFANDRRLSPEEYNTLLTWIEEGCAEGPREETPPNPTFTDGWRIGEPDLVLTMKTPFAVPAKAPPGGIPYKYFVVATDFPEERWVQAVEAKPGNRGVVHHIIAYVREPGKGRNRQDGIGDGMLVAFAPGDLPGIFEPGMAKRIPKGASIYFQMHYTPNGTAGTDQSSIGMIFAKEKPTYEVKTRSIQNPRFEIPPGDSNHVVHASGQFRQEVVLLSMSPHMHLRGKSFEYRLVYPDGRSETVLSVPKYDFNWQTHYRLEKPLTLPAGTRIECTAAFDNSEENPNNPDPRQPVRWGDQTWEEMMIGFLDYHETKPLKK